MPGVAQFKQNTTCEVILEALNSDLAFASLTLLMNPLYGGLNAWKVTKCEAAPVAGGWRFYVTCQGT